MQAANRLSGRRRALARIARKDSSLFRRFPFRIEVKRHAGREPAFGTTTRLGAHRQKGFQPIQEVSIPNRSEAACKRRTGFRDDDAPWRASPERIPAYSGGFQSESK